MLDTELIDSLELNDFRNDLINIERQYMNLIYNPLLDCVQEKNEYEKSLSLIRWKCAICGCDILADKNRIDVENFVCDKCKEYYNNKSDIDMRIIYSRTKMYKYIEEKLYEELEDNLKGGVN